MKIGKPSETEVIFVGMHRPELTTVRSQIKPPFDCPMGHTIMTSSGFCGEYCHAQGCFDVPIYVSLEELVQAGWNPQGESK